MLTDLDYAVSATCLMIPDYLKSLGDIEIPIKRILDLGCAYGGISRLTGKYFRAKDIWGVDMDMEGINVCRKSGINAIYHNLNDTPYPFLGGLFDLIICNGVLEHLYWFDGVISEAHRLLNERGNLLITLPNMANYFHRISLLFGYQPTDIAISRKLVKNTGTLIWAGANNYDHIRTATVKAMKLLLEYYGFKVISVRRGNPELTGVYAKWNWLSRLINFLVPVTMARRIIVLARKEKALAR